MAWSPLEDAMLLQAAKDKNKCWIQVSESGGLGGRKSEDECRERYSVLTAISPRTKKVHSPSHYRKLNSPSKQKLMARLNQASHIRQEVKVNPQHTNRQPLARGRVNRSPTKVQWTIRSSPIFGSQSISDKLQNSRSSPCQTTISPLGPASFKSYPFNNFSSPIFENSPFICSTFTEDPIIESHSPVIRPKLKPKRIEDINRGKPPRMIKLKAKKVKEEVVEDMPFNSIFKEDFQFFGQQTLTAQPQLSQFDDFFSSQPDQYQEYLIPSETDRYQLLESDEYRGPDVNTFNNQPNWTDLFSDSFIQSDLFQFDQPLTEFEKAELMIPEGEVDDLFKESLDEGAHRMKPAVLQEVNWTVNSGGGFSVEQAIMLKEQISKFVQFTIQAVSLERDLHGPVKGGTFLEDQLVSNNLTIANSASHALEWEEIVRIKVNV